MNTNLPPAPAVHVTRRLPFSTERVFDAWLDPAIARQWLFATPAGRMVRAETDARPGGKFTFTEIRDGKEFEHTGEYLEIDRPRRLVFTFGLPQYAPGFDRVTVVLTPEKDGCHLALTHEMRPDMAVYAGRSQNGWTTLMQNLAALLGDRAAAANREPGVWSAPNEVRFTRLLPGPIERVWAYLTESDKRAQWFAGGPMDLRPGGGAEFHFRHRNLAPTEDPPEKYKEVHDPGVSFEVRILRCEPPRLLSYTWPGEEDGEADSEVTFELTPEGNHVRLQLTHSRAGNRKTLQSVSGGWHTHVALLTALLEENSPPPFWTLLGSVEGEYSKRPDPAG